MLGHGRPVQTSLAMAFAIILAIGFAGLVLPSQIVRADNAIATESLPIAWQDDGELTDTCFVSQRIGWAVGAQGVILRTVDGGKTWLQPSEVSIGAVQQQVNESLGKLPLSEKLSRMQQGPQTRLRHRNVVADASRQEIRVRFESVHFVDANHGWVAGGYNVPWMDHSRGLVMRTADGGKTWHRVDRLTIPRVKKIHFTSQRMGWAIGETNALHPNGIYFTNDGGSTWSDQSNTRMPAWITGQQAGGQFVLIDQTGRLGSVLGGTMKRPALFGCTRDDRIDCLAMQNDRDGFAVGQGGLILKTTDGGDSWKRWSIDTGLAGSARWAVINEQSLFIAPATGGLVRVGIQDKTAERIELPTLAPIRKIQFVDQEIGFAIGDFGTILSTVDGGLSWRKQRGDHERLAMLFVANRPQDLSLSLMAYNAGEESRLCGTFLMDDRPTGRDVATQAFERVGSVVNWRSGATSESQRAAELVAAIRAVKPLAVVVCHDLSSSDRYRNAISLKQMVAKAIEQSADAALSDNTLRPWQVQRLIASDLAGSVRLDSRRMMPAMGLTVSDQVAVSRTLLGQSTRAKKITNWRVTHLVKNRIMKGNDLLSGLARTGAPVPARKRRTALGNLNRMNQAIARQKQSEQLIKMTVETDQDLAAWRQAALSVTATTEENLAGLWLVDLAEQYLEAGRFDLVDLSLETLTTYLAKHAFSPAANAWLTVKRSQEFHAIESAAPSSNEQRRALESFLKLTQHDPSLVLDPAWQWMELNLLAKSSSLRSVEPKLAQLSQLRATDHANQVYAALARKELSLLRLDGDVLGSAAARQKANFLDSNYAKERPKLDGQLDDELWENARTQQKTTTFNVKSSTSETDTDEIIFAHDDQFVYGAIRCRKLTGQAYRSEQKTRTRDPDLSQHDRVELTIDPSLTYCGSIKLTLDYRGWVSDSKLAGRNWNPDWYVAAAQGEDTWNVEFAIPISVISQRAPGQPVHPSDPCSRGWGVKISRLDDRSRSVWDQGPASAQLTGLQASLKPDPTGFRRLIFANHSDLLTSKRDPHVRPVQYQLESIDGSDSDRFASPPQVPELGGSGRGIR